MNIYSNVNCLYHGFYLYIHALVEDFSTSTQQISKEYNQMGELNKSVQAKSLRARKQLKEVVETHVEAMK